MKIKVTKEDKGGCAITSAIPLETCQKPPINPSGCLGDNLNSLVRSDTVQPRRKVWVVNYIDSDRYSDQVMIAGVASTENNRDMMLDAYSENEAVASEVTLDLTTCPALGALISGTAPKW